MRLIDADALQREYAKYHDGKRIVIVDLAPTIEERKGKWIDVNEGKWNTIEVLKCSVCGEMDNRMNRTDNFCPNCGADMREQP